MKLNCTYITNADIGEFRLPASVDLDTGEVVEIITDTRMQNIEKVYSEQIEIMFGDKAYYLDVVFDDCDTSVDLKELMSLPPVQLHKKLDENLESTPAQTKRKKI